MSRTVGIFGQGNVGAAVAHQLVVSGMIDHLVLFDTNEGKAEADAIDYRDAMMNLPHHTKISYNDNRLLDDCDILISTVGSIGMVQNNDRFGELGFNTKAVEGISQNIKNSQFDGVMIVISNPNDVIASLYQQETGLPKERVIGTGTLLDSARLHRALGEAFDVDPRSVEGYVLGEHGNSQFSAWSTVRINGQAATDLLANHTIDADEIGDSVRDGGFVVLNGKGYTNYGVAAAAVRLALTVFNDAHTLLPVSHYLPEYDSYLSYPAIVGKDGIVADAKLKLTDEEKAQLKQSAAFIQEKLHS
ncbi:MAG: L-lactate dehydrogenase [Aerococcus sp.]|nr:L-lactate dehydrogenase [Aerococcus sp.]